MTITPTGLSAGYYAGQLAVSAPNTTSAIVKVLLVVYAPSVFVVQPASLAFTYQTGQPGPAPQLLYVASQGKQVSLTAAVSGGSWLAVDTAAANTPVNLSVAVHPSQLTPGSYSAAVTLTAPGVPAQTVPVTLTVAPPPPTFTAAGIGNAASLLSGPVAPGEIVVLSGGGFSGSGLLTAAAGPSGKLPVILGNTQVYFDGIAAPLLWLRPNQLSAIVPFEVANEVSTKVWVAYDGAESQPAVIPVVSAAPGLYTADGSGQGPVLALNSDGTLNSASNPAAAGSEVSVYLSGGGQTVPAGVDGLITGSHPPVLAGPIKVTVGGLPAQVTYAGDVPQFAAGAVQVNFVVPSGLIPGNAPILLSGAAGSSSQPNVVLAIK